MKTYQIKENGETYWTGKANDVDHALEKCYEDEMPGSMVEITVMEYRRVKLTSQITTMGWRQVWSGNLSTHY